MKKKVYFAAGLFNLADKYFNASLSKELSKVFEVNLPQRMGFEFSKLHQALEGVVEDNEKEDVVNHLIYYYDLAFLLPQSDFCIARLDEPTDPGVDVEIMEAKKIRIPVIGYRTDCRTPYGSNNNEVRGAHFFPLYNCDMLINFTSKNISDVEEGNKSIKALAGLIYQGTEKIKFNYNDCLPHKDINTTSGIHYIANSLFREIEDLHSEKGLKEIVRRYEFMKGVFGSMVSTEIVQA